MTSLKDYFAKKSAVPEISSSSRCRSTTVFGLKMCLLFGPAENMAVQCPPTIKAVECQYCENNQN